MSKIDEKICQTKNLISVVTPSYNQAQFIEHTLRSVRKQDYNEIEHWVIDGGSTDGTLEILDEFQSKTKLDKHYNLKWISESDTGQSNAINKGFERATGEIVGWLNSDDMYFDTHTLQAVEEAFLKDDAKIIYGDYVLVDPENKILRVGHMYDFSRKRLLRSCFICQPALFFHRSVLEKHRLDESLEYVMDYEFWLRLSKTYQFSHIHRILAADRNHANRKMLLNREALSLERESVQEKYGQSFDEEYWVGRLADKLYSIYNRLRGVPTILNIIRREDIAFPLCIDSPGPIFLRQLFAKNRNLI